MSPPAEYFPHVEAGETLLVTVAGRPVAELSPAPRRRWISGDILDGIWRGPTPQCLADDLAELPGALGDPFAR